MQYERKKDNKVGVPSQTNVNYLDDEDFKKQTC